MAVSARSTPPAFGSLSLQLPPFPEVPLLQRSFLATLAILLLAAQIHAEDWPRWRGPRGDGITSETIPDKLPKEGPKKLWSKEVGIGYSSPVAVDGKIYMFALADGRDTL